MRAGGQWLAAIQALRVNGKGLEMITLETTSEKIRAWRCAKGLSAPIMSCAIFASALRFRRRRSAPGQAQRGQPKATPPRGRAPATRHLRQRTGEAGPGPSLNGSWVSSALRFESGTISRSRRNKQPESKRSKSTPLSDGASSASVLARERRGTQW